MFGDSNSKIGTREFAATIMYILAIELSDATPATLFKIGKNAGWMVSLVAGVVAFISLAFLLKLLKRYKDKGLMEIVYHLTGKYVGFIIGMILFYMMILFTAVNTRSYVDIIRVNFFEKTPILAIYLLLIGSSLYIASRGFEGIGRVSYITMPYVLMAAVIYVTLILKQSHLEYLKPIFGSGIKNIIKGGITDSSIYGEIIIIAALYSQVRGYKEYKLGSLIGLGFGVALVSFYTLLYVCVFDYPPVIIINNHFHTAARLIYVGRFIGNMEAFFLIFWLVGAIVRYSVYIYVTASYFAFTFKLKETKPLLFPCAAIALMLGMIPENVFQAVSIVKKILLTYSWILIYSLPIFLYMLSNFKEGSKQQS